MIDKNKAMQIRDDINIALATVAAKHGLSKLSIASGSFRDETVTYKVDGVKAGGKSKEELHYDRYRQHLNLPPLGTVFSYNKEDYKITGLNKTRTQVFVTQVSSDKAYRMPTHDVVSAAGVDLKPTLPLAEFTAATNALAKAECERINAGKGGLKPIFGASHFDYPEQMLAHYHGKGFSPEQTLQAIRAESEAERRFEARAS